MDECEPLISGGANMAGALKLAAKVPKGSVILTLLADTSERYMSTPLYESIAADMDEDVGLSASPHPPHSVPVLATSSTT